MFYVETLADLEKTTRAGRTPENEVAIIARRTPEFSGAPCVHHSTLCIGELLGHRLPLNGQIPVAGGRPVKVEGKSGVVIEHTPEAKAFLRWQQGKFLELERDFASDWRASLNSLDLSEIANRFKKLGVTGKNCRSLAEAKVIADGVVKGRDKPFDTIGLALTFLNIPRDYHQQIIHRWSIDGYPALVE